MDGPLPTGEAVNASGVYDLRRLVDPEAVIRAWWDWKKTNSLYEHDDYVHLAIDVGAPAPAPVIIIDEFQDLSPLQNRLFRAWLDDPLVKRIYVAGDPNQAIYDFRGANPRFLEDAHRLVMEAGPRMAVPKPSLPGKHLCAGGSGFRYASRIWSRRGGMGW